MTDRPILFSAPMVRALLDGRKTQTRLVINPGDVYDDIPGDSADDFLSRGWAAFYRGDMLCAAKPRFLVGDRLWVREAWRCNGWATDMATIFYRASSGNSYTEMCEQYPVHGRKYLRPSGNWRPSIHLPRWASRLTLTVTDVRVQRLQDISEEDAIAEGVVDGVAEFDYDCGPRVVPWFTVPGVDDPGCGKSAADMFLTLWQHINGAGSVDANPWVAAYTFTVHHRNIDALEAA